MNLSSGEEFLSLSENRGPVRRFSPIASVLTGLGTVLLLLGTVYTSGMADGDLFWQMAYGRQLLESGSLIPDHTTMTWSGSSNDVIYCAWTAEIFFELLYRQAGLTGVYVFRYVLLTLVVLALWKFGSRMACPGPPRALGVTLFLGGSSAGAYLKPELFSVFFFSVCVLVLYLFKADPGGVWPRRGIALSPLLIALWANTHGGFLFASLLYGGFLVGESLNFAFKRSGHLKGKDWKLVALSMLGIGVAVFLTPYGYRYPLQLVQDRLMSDNNTAMMSYVSAWEPSLSAQFEHLMTRETFASLVALCLLTQLLARRLDFTFWIHNIVFGAFFLLYVRVTYLWPVLAVVSMIYLLRERDWSSRSSVPLGVACLVLPLFLAGRMAYLFVFTPVADSHWGMGPGYNNPVLAAELIKRLPPDIKVANDYACGGYLVWALYPGRQTMIDPRGFPFRAWFDSYLEFAHGERTLDFLTINDCKVVVTKSNMKVLRGHLEESKEWRCVLLEPAALTYLHTSVKEPVVSAVLQDQAYSKLRNWRTNKLILPAAVNMGRMDWAEKFLEQAESLAIGQEEVRHQRDFYEASLAFGEKRYDDAMKHYQALYDNRQMTTNTRLELLYKWKSEQSRKQGDEQTAKEYEAKLAELKR